ncbi:5'-nucleotidase C-terminal domain-containing protein [Bacteroidales bacterium OttesenSCG-928-L03]|nr:5'-nucleotidase C-terminal domain-containing protein [Bacteroidales bacterium OttesenSCG-928-L03]
MKKVNCLSLLFSLILFASCAQKQYQVTGIEASRVMMDSTWDAKANPQLLDRVNSYKTALESEMNVKIGTAAQTMIKGQPQSLLTNLTADVLRKRAQELWGHIDFAVMNRGGLRSTLNQGDITIGSLFEIYSFDNTLTLVELPGRAVAEFFDHIAEVNGQGLSDNLEVVINKGKVASIRIGGQALDPNKTYRIATLDYLAEGNDGMLAFKQATNKLNSGELLRDIMIEYVKEQTANNQEIDAKLDNRIIVNP